MNVGVHPSSTPEIEKDPKNSGDKYFESMANLIQ